MMRGQGLTYAQMDLLCREILPLIQHKTLLQFQEGVERHYYLSFSGGQTLLLSLQHPFLRFHLVKHLPKVKQSPFTKSINSKLEGSLLQSLQLLNNDRILRLSFRSKLHEHHLVAEFFPKRPNLYFCDSEMHIIEALNPARAETYQLPENPKPLATDTQIKEISSAAIERFYQEKELEEHFLREKQKIEKEICSLLKRSQKRKNSAQLSLESCSGWEQVQHEGLLLQSNQYRIKKGMSEILIADWADNSEKRIELDPKIEPHTQVERRFRKSKKLREGMQHYRRLINECDNEMKTHQQTLEVLAKANTMNDLKVFQAPKAATPDKAVPFREYNTESGLKLWVGKSAKDNDSLTFQYAKGSDWWLHVRDFPGSHVVLRVKKGQEPDPGSIEDAIQLALAYSKAKDKGEVEVCITQCKYVSKFGKNPAGKVHISKQRIVRAAFDPVRFQKLKHGTGTS